MNYEEAKEYYGEELCNLLIKIFDFCKQSGYVIYQHATDLDSANSIMKKLKAIENIFEQDTEEEEVSRVFNSKAYDEILNTTESVKRIVFGIENDKNKNKEQTPWNDSVKELLMKLDNLEGIK